MPWTEEDERRLREQIAKDSRPRLPWWKLLGFVVAWLVLLGILDALGVLGGGWLI